jgi:hypothetical protein
MNAPVSFFVAGTDTEIVKTLVSAALLHGFAQQGLRVAAIRRMGCVTMGTSAFSSVGAPLFNPMRPDSRHFDVLERQTPDWVFWRSLGRRSIASLACVTNGFGSLQSVIANLLCRPSVGSHFATS